MKTSENIEEIGKALSIMQGSMVPAKKGSINPFFKSTYADLPSVLQAIRGPLAENGLSVVQEATTSQEGVSVVTRVLHSSGQWIEFGPFTIPLGKKDAQSVGSACSYAKRYALSAALAISAEKDDDGNRATKSVHEEKKICPEATQKDLENFVNDYCDLYSKEDIQEYIEERAKHYKHSVLATVHELVKEESSTFQKNIDMWIKRKNKNAPI